MLTVLIDDLRSFRDDREAVVLRSSSDALTYLRANRVKLDELWLDHDLGGDDDIRPVVLLLEERAFNGEPIEVDVVLVHSMNPVGASAVVAGLQHYGYNAKRIGTEQLISAPVPE